MKHPLSFLLRFGRTDADRVALLGDLEEERRARIARGRGRFSTFLWQTGQIISAWAYSVRDAVRRRTSHGTQVRPRLAAYPWSRFVSWPDLKLSLRLLFRYPGLTLVASFGIAVGIAICAGFFAFAYSPSPWYEIIGVTESLSTNLIDPDGLQPFVFYPVAAEQISTASFRLHVRGSAAAGLESGLPQRLHRLAASVDPALRLGEIRPSAFIDIPAALKMRLIGLTLAMVMATVLLLSAAGVYA